MAMNITEVRLCAVPLENDYKHTISFPDSVTQRNYFIGKTVHSGANFSYQRKDNVIRYPKHFDELQNCNYVMYKNNAYTEKWFYAFITEMIYINDEMTAIHFETDVLQTYMFDYTVQPSFIEREHVAEDNPGEHTIDEGLELGEYTVNRHTKANYGGDITEDSIVVIGVTKNPDGSNVAGSYYDGIYSGVQYYGFTGYDITINKAIENFIAQYDKDAAGDAIVCMFMCPKNLVALKEGGGITASNLVSRHFINYSGETDYPEEIRTLVDITTHQVDGYNPRNQKLKCFPYRYLTVSNNCGGAIPLKYERFFKISGDTKTYIPPEFEIDGCLTPGCSVRLVPLNYNGCDRNDDEGINLGKYPVLNWTSDVYTNWLTQNGVNIALDIVSGVGQIAAGVALAAASGGVGTAVGGGGVIGGVNQIAGTLAQMHQQSFTPPQVKGNINAGDAVTASDQNDFHFYDMSIKAEYAKIIDDYFDMFGYKCNRVKTPAKWHRQRWWYTKTIDASIDGAIPMKDMQTIKNCYNNGVTFWRHDVVIGAYKDADGIPYDNGVL